MERELRNALRSAVTACRRQLEDSVRRQLEGQFGIYAAGRITDESRMTNLAPEDLAFRRDLVAGLHVVRSDVDVPAIHLDVTVRNELTRAIAGVGQTEPINHIIEPCLQKLEQCLPRHTAFAQCVLENPAELLFEQSILVTELLLFAESDRVIGLFTTRAFGAMHPRRIIFPLE